MTTVDIEEVAFDALREMYREAEPPLDFDDALKNPEDYDDGWYQQHSLPRDRQREIVDKHCEKHNLTGQQRTSVTWTAILQYGPTYQSGDDDE